MGENTIIKHSGTGASVFIELKAKANIVEKIVIDGENTERTSTTGIECSYLLEKCLIQNMVIRNFLSIQNSFSIYFQYALSIVTVSKCRIQNIIAGGNAAGILYAYRAEYNYIDTITTTGGGSYIAYGIRGSTKCMQNVAKNCTTAPYYESYADSGTAYPCADTADGGYNS
jgi:hypothetical protein